jgi:hypothetical protein
MPWSTRQLLAGAACPVCAVVEAAPGLRARAGFGHTWPARPSLGRARTAGPRARAPEATVPAWFGLRPRARAPEAAAGPLPTQPPWPACRGLRTRVDGHAPAPHDGAARPPIRAAAEAA